MSTHDIFIDIREHIIVLTPSLISDFSCLVKALGAESGQVQVSRPLAIYAPNFTFFCKFLKDRRPITRSSSVNVIGLAVAYKYSTIIGMVNSTTKRYTIDVFPEEAVAKSPAEFNT